MTWYCAPSKPKYLIPEPPKSRRSWLLSRSRGSKGHHSGYFGGSHLVAPSRPKYLLFWCPQPFGSQVEARKLEDDRPPNQSQRAEIILHPCSYTAKPVSFGPIYPLKGPLHPCSNFLESTLRAPIRDSSKECWARRLALDSLGGPVGALGPGPDTVLSQGLGSALTHVYLSIYLS